MKQLRFGKFTCMIAVFCVATAVASHAQTFKSLFSFDGTDGSNPFSPLVQGTDGNLYGTTCCGGAYGMGTVFRMSRAGNLTTIYSFCSLANCEDGEDPASVGLSLGIDGNLYGSTVSGGKNGKGTLFRITSSGTLTTLHSFTAGGDGWMTSGLTLGPDGSLYGTTQYAGYYGNGFCHAYGCGTLFKLSTSGLLSNLYTFCVQTTCTNGANPAGGLTLGNDGNFYGTTASGGANSMGTVYKVTPTGILTTLYSFCSQTNCPDGEDPFVGLVQSNNGNFYGTTYSAGPHGAGSVFEITPAGAFTTVYGFCSRRNCEDGANPRAALIQGNDGNLYGTTMVGGAASFGFAFGMTPAGKISPIYNFCSQANCADGNYPMAALIQATDGRFYSTTEYGGTTGQICTPNDVSCGTVFAFSVGLPAFVEALPIASNVGRTVVILGDNLAGTTSVTFNGFPAAFRVVSRTAIKTTVPAGATTGTIQVTTPTGTLNSNVAFQVLP